MLGSFLSDEVFEQQVQNSIDGQQFGVWKTAFTMATSIVHSKLDYCNSIFLNIESIFLNLESTQLKRLQLIQNSLARVVSRTSKHHHITPILKSLHLLKNPRANSLQSLLPNLQLPTTLPAQISPRILHHPASALYTIILRSQSFSTPGH